MSSRCTCTMYRCEYCRNKDDARKVLKCLLAMAVGAVITLLLIAPLVFGQTTPPQAAVRLQDGSLLFLSMQQTAIEVETRYGRLTIPLADVRSIDVGSHFADEVSVKQAIVALAGDKHTDRDKAQRYLQASGPNVYPLVLAAVKSEDVEGRRRAELLVRWCQENHKGKLKDSAEDVVTTDTLKVTGRLLGDGLKVRSVHLGDMTLGWHAMASVRFQASETTLTVPVGDDWTDTGSTSADRAATKPLQEPPSRLPPVHWLRRLAMGNRSSWVKSTADRLVGGGYCSRLSRTPGELTTRASAVTKQPSGANSDG